MGQQQEKTEQDGLDRSPAQFFFETGYFAAYAEACAEIGKAPFALSDRIVERAWDVAGEAHDDRAEFDAYLARANGSAAPNTPASNDFVLVREAAQRLVDRFPADLPDYSPAADEVKALRLALASAPASPEPASNEAPGRGGVGAVEGSLNYRVSWPRPATPCDLVPLWKGEFRDFDDWVSFATTRLTGTTDERGVEVSAICVDALGRRCSVGAHFMRARDEGAFPVRYFWECSK